MVKKRISLVFAIAVGLCMAVSVSAELFHFHKFGHFVGYGIHTDIVSTDSHDTRFAVLWNLTFKSFDIEGCRLPGGYAGEGIIYQWDIQKWDAYGKRWMSLRGANTWVPTPFGGYYSSEPCLSEVTHIGPFRSRKVGWVYKDWVTTGEPIPIGDSHIHKVAARNAAHCLYAVLHMAK